MAPDQGLYGMPRRTSSWEENRDTTREERRADKDIGEEIRRKAME